MNLLETQRRMAAAMMVPLTAEGRVAVKTARGTSTKAEAALILKPNDRLTSLERLEIYSRSYWFRLLDSFTEDFPGLEAIVGRERFAKLATQYLRQCPSRSFTLRDLGAQLVEWLTENPAYLGEQKELALDMARLEWAHIVAFDGAQAPLLDPEHLLEPSPEMRIGLQPYLSLLEVQYPVDELRVAIRATDDGRHSASNSSGRRKSHAVRKVGRSRKQALTIAVHRVDASVYYRRLEPEEYRLLRALQRGQPIGRAIFEGLNGSQRTPDEVPQLLQEWFGAWAQFGWLTVFEKRKKGRESR
ncbi:MAG: putative DNA-binding domain-containing protein [Bryobacteraceae bacterium]